MTTNEHPKTSPAQSELDALRNLLQQQANEIGRLQKLYWESQSELTKYQAKFGEIKDWWKDEPTGSQRHS